MSPATARSAIAQGTSHDEAALRRAMIECQLRTNGVNDAALLAALERVSRMAHVPAHRHALAYSDRAIPLTRARALNPTLTTARLIGRAHIGVGDKVLLIGAATGYAAALLAAMGANVTAVESDHELLGWARPALAGLSKVTLVEAPLAIGWPTGAPFDHMVIDGAVETIPESLVGQLASGGRIVAGLRRGSVTSLVCAARQVGAAGVEPVSFADLECVLLPGFAAPPTFAF